METVIAAIVKRYPVTGTPFSSLHDTLQLIAIIALIRNNPPMVVRNLSAIQPFLINGPSHRGVTVTACL